MNNSENDQDFENKSIFNILIHEYLVCNNLTESANIFKSEANIGDYTDVDKSSVLFEWFKMFNDICKVRSGNLSDIDGLARIEAIMVKLENDKMRYATYPITKKYKSNNKIRNDIESPHSYDLRPDYHMQKRNGFNDINRLPPDHGYYEELKRMNIPDPGNMNVPHQMNQSPHQMNINSRHDKREMRLSPQVSGKGPIPGKNLISGKVKRKTRMDASQTDNLRNEREMDYEGQILPPQSPSMNKIEYNYPQFNAYNQQPYYNPENNPENYQNYYPQNYYPPNYMPHPQGPPQMPHQMSPQVSQMQNPNFQRHKSYQMNKIRNSTPNQSPNQNMSSSQNTPHSMNTPHNMNMNQNIKKRQNTPQFYSPKKKEKKMENSPSQKIIEIQYFDRKKKINYTTHFIKNKFNLLCIAYEDSTIEVYDLDSLKVLRVFESNVKNIKTISLGIISNRENENIVIILNSREKECKIFNLSFNGEIFSNYSILLSSLSLSVHVSESFFYILTLDGEILKFEHQNEQNLHSIIDSVNVDTNANEMVFYKNEEFIIKSRTKVFTYDFNEKKIKKTISNDPAQYIVKGPIFTKNDQENYFLIAIFYKELIEILDENLKPLKRINVMHRLNTLAIFDIDNLFTALYRKIYWHHLNEILQLDERKSPIISLHGYRNRQIIENDLNIQQNGKLRLVSVTVDGEIKICEF